MQRRGQIWISAVIYILIVVVALVIILSVAQPLLNKMRDKAYFSDSKQQMSSLDRQISEVASEGPGSQRVIPIDISQGKIVLSNGGLEYQLETDSKVVEPNTETRLGNLVISSGFDVSSTKTNDTFILENSRIKVVFNNSGNITDTVQIIQTITLKENNESLNSGFRFIFDDGDGTTGTGSYTTLLDEGSALPSASVKAVINQSNILYNLILTLDSNADFIKVEVE